MPEEQLYDQPRFSHAERDRRWTAVREAMAAQNVDCVIAPNNRHPRRTRRSTTRLPRVGLGTAGNHNRPCRLDDAPEGAVTRLPGACRSVQLRPS